MANAPRLPETDGAAPTPRWVYAVGIVVIVLALAFAASHYTGGIVVGGHH